VVPLKEQLRRQLSFVITSCHAYDRGHREEAIRIATAARVLFHDTPSSRSLVRGHMRLEKIKLRSTCANIDDHGLGFIGLEPSSASFRPYLDDVVRDEQVDVETWWRREPIMKLMKANEVINRRQLILAASNKDGGAHIDASIPSEYDRLEAGVGIKAGVKFASGERKLVTLRFANLAALRQIGHELLTSHELTALLQ